MDTFLAVLMALGIFVVIPTAIGFAIANIFVRSGRRERRDRRAEAVGHTTSEQTREAGS